MYVRNCSFLGDCLIFPLKLYFLCVFCYLAFAYAVSLRSMIQKCANLITFKIAEILIRKIRIKGLK